MFKNNFFEQRIYIHCVESGGVPVCCYVGSFVLSLLEKLA